jgi:GTP-binding protein
MADIPGIIENAHLGKGLGHRFLRHIERNSLLLFVIPADTQNIAEEYNVLVRELEMYNPELVHKPRLLGVSKADLIDAELKKLISKELPHGIDHVFFSAVSGAGLPELKDKIWAALDKPMI